MISAMLAEAVVFDSHRFVKNLTANGFTEQQAEALAAETVAMMDGHLATKADLVVLKLELKSELLKWILGAMLAQTGLIAGLMLALVGLR